MAEITLRQNKTTALTFAEMDTNLDNINSELVANTNFLNQATDNNIASTLVFRNTSGDISVSTVHGNLDGTASLVTSVAENTSATEQNITFVTGQAGSKAVKTDSTLTYNPATNKLTAGVFSGTATLTSLTNTGNTTLGTTGANTLTVHASPTFNANVIMAGTLAVNGSSITTSNATFNLANTSATTVNFAGAATALTIGAVTGTTAIRNALTIQGGTAWHSGNDGAGSSLDADLLDGYQSSVSAQPNTVVVRDGSGAIVGTITGTTDNANKVAVVDTNTAGTFYPTFVNSADITAGYATMRVDSATTPITYNPNTNTLTVANLSGNASTATKWATARTITLGGDLSGNTSIDGTSNVTLNATIVANSVALGTDTTGNYIGTGATSGNGISGSATGEGSTFTVTSNATAANSANTIVYRDASGNFSAGTITAALSGNATTATTLQTARTINGVSFNGGSNITVEPYVENDEATNATRYLVFVDNSTGGFKRLNEDSSLTYNPSSNTLTAGTFSGTLSGNATTATTASNAQLLDNLDSTAFIRSNANDDVTAHTEWQDNQQVRLGGGADTRMYHNGSHSYVDQHTGNLYIRNAGTENMAAFIRDAQVELYYNGNKKLATSNTGVDVTGELTTTGQVIAGAEGYFTNLMGKNKIINGNFDIWQRGTSQTSGGYKSVDRWITAGNGASFTTSRQSFTVGQTDVPGNPQFFARVNLSSSGTNPENYTYFRQKIEGVRSFAGEQVTLSFYAKANASKTVAISFTQAFGAGGSSAVSPAGAVNQISLTTSWQKFEITVTLPSISGKTVDEGSDFLAFQFWLSAGSDFNSQTNSLGSQTGIFDFSRVQLERGSVATPFEERGRAVERALCYRYYEKSYEEAVFAGTNNALGSVVLSGASDHNGAILSEVKYLVEKRVTPTLAFYTIGGVSGQWTYRRSGIGNTDATVNVNFAGTSNFNVFVLTGVVWNPALLQGHWEADAEI